MACCRDFSRGILIFTNVFFLMLGAVLIALGCYMVDTPRLSIFSEGGFAGIIIGCGMLVILIAILGYCGAHCDNRMFLACYAVFIIFSICAQMALAGVMYQVHLSLTTVASNGYDVHGLTEWDKDVYDFVEGRFEKAYTECDPKVRFELEYPKDDRAIQIHCRNSELDWFVPFVEEYCTLQQVDLIPGSNFLSCTGQDIFSAKRITEHIVFCACQSHLIQWLNEQGSMIGLITLCIGVFECFLVLLSCTVICSRRRRRKGYQELRMPVKQSSYRSNNQRGYYYQTDNVQGVYGRPIHQHQGHNQNPSAGFASAPPTGSSLTSSPNIIPYAQPVNYQTNTTGSTAPSKY